MNFTPIQKMFDKPSTWLAIVLVLVVCAAVLLICHDEEWSSWGFSALGFSFMGRLWTMGSMEGSQRWCRLFLVIIAVLIFFPVIDHELRTGPDGKSRTPLGAIVGLGRGFVQDVRNNLAKPPPLDVRVDRRTEYLGLENVEFLLITNKSGNGVVPVKLTLERGQDFMPIELPPVIKPYETIEIRLAGKRSKVFIEKGDSLRFECEDFSKPLILTW